MEITINLDITNIDEIWLMAELIVQAISTLLTATIEMHLL